jgi:1-pyrroline dehydrogenase
LIVSNKQQFIINKQIFVDGKFIECNTDEYYDVINPATKEVLGTIPLCNEEDINLAISSAEKAFKSWKKLTIADRSNYLLNAVSVIEEHREALAQVESENVGKPINVALADVDVLIDNLKFFAGAARGLTNIASDNYATGSTSFIRREPLGVVGSITPWNYPIMMAGWKFAPALVMGNTVVLKPSEFTPFSTLLLADILKDVLPPGVLNVITAKGETAGDAFLKSIHIKMISLTGSIKAGQYLVKNSSDSLKKIHLELGGKAPSIVFNDANLKEAVETLSMSAFYNSGQECTAVTRIYVENNVFDKFVELLKVKMSKIVMGDPTNAETDMGPLVSKAHFDRVTDFVERAKSRGVQVITAQNIPSVNKGYYYPPTLLLGMNNDDEVIQNEIFGPVVAIMPFSTEDAAYNLANDSKYALAASVWTENVSKALRATENLEAGTVWVNTHLMFVSEMPHSGGKMSGHGKDQSLYAFDEYSQVKHVMLKN